MTRRVLGALGKVIRLVSILVWVAFAVCVFLTVGISLHGAILGFVAGDVEVFGWCAAVLVSAYVVPLRTVHIAMAIFGTFYAWLVRRLGDLAWRFSWLLGALVFLLAAATADWGLAAVALYLLYLGNCVRTSFSECIATLIELLLGCFRRTDPTIPEIPPRAGPVVPDSGAAQCEADSYIKASFRKGRRR